MIPRQLAAEYLIEYVDSMPVKYIMEIILNTRIKNNRPLQDLIEYFIYDEVTSSLIWVEGMY